MVLLILAEHLLKYKSLIVFKYYDVAIDFHQTLIALLNNKYIYH